MTADPWREATFDGHESEQRRRWAALPPSQRWAACEQMLRMAHAAGHLQRWRDRKQRDLLAAWESTED